MFGETVRVLCKQVLEDELRGFGRVKLLELLPRLVFCDVRRIDQLGDQATHEKLACRPF